VCARAAPPQPALGCPPGRAEQQIIFYGEN